MSIAYICSPYKAKTKEKFDEQYKHTKEVAREVVLGGFEVIAPHLYYPKFLDDHCDTERFTGLQSALRLINVCDVMFVSMKQEVSSGMDAEIELTKQKSIPIYYFRSINELRDLLKKQTSQNRATNAKVPHNKTKDSSEKNTVANIDYLENKMSIVLDCVTRGRISKPYTDINLICEAINGQEARLREEAVKDYKEEKEEKCDECLHHPKPNENYPEECVMCSLFYSSSWERK